MHARSTARSAARRGSLALPLVWLCTAGFGPCDNASAGDGPGGATHPGHGGFHPISMMPDASGMSGASGGRGDAAQALDDPTSDAGGSTEDDGASAGATCGTPASISCATDLYCDLTAGDGCDVADAAGVCAERPTLCDQQYDPVCGCDGTTYGNTCAAAALGVSVDKPGACTTTEDGKCECSGPAPLAAVMVCADGSMSGPLCQRAGGSCEWTIRTCPLETPADAGIDAGAGDAGARDAGIDASAQDAAEPDASARDAALDASAEADDEPQEAECDPEACAGRPSRAPNVLCDDGTIGGPVCERDDDDVCTWTLRTCPADLRCGGIAGFACPDEMYCDHAAGDGCDVVDGIGVCSQRPDACPAIYDPVCGCDGRPYSSACAAAGRGISVRERGLCL